MSNILCWRLPHASCQRSDDRINLPSPLQWEHFGAATCTVFGWPALAGAPRAQGCCFLSQLSWLWSEQVPIFKGLSKTFKICWFNKYFHVLVKTSYLVEVPEAFSFQNKKTVSSLGNWIQLLNNDSLKLKVVVLTNISWISQVSLFMVIFGFLFYDTY